MKVPRRYEILLFSLFLSLFMSAIVSGIATVRTLGLVEAAWLAWAKNFATAWPVAFPAVLLVAPLVRRLVARLLAAAPAHA